MKSVEKTKPMCIAGRRAMGALFGCALVFGPGVGLHETSNSSIASTSPPTGFVLELAFPKAHADSKRRKRTRKRNAARRRAQQKRRREAEKILEGTRRDTLPADCVYDSYASFTGTSDIFVCGGVYYQRYEEDGVTGFEGHAVGIDRGAIKRARARRAIAEKKRQEETKKNQLANRKATLSTDCAYDSYASFASTSNVYTCGGIQYRQYKENGIIGYQRRTAGKGRGLTKELKVGRAKAQRKRRAQTGPAKNERVNTTPTLARNCFYDSYASFFTSSNVYSCGGIRYRQYQENGVTGYEVLDL